MKKFIIVTHKFLTLPDDELVSYLVEKGNLVLHINHSFNDAPDRVTKADIYYDKKLQKTYKSFDFKFLPEVLVYFKEFIYTNWYILRSLKFEYDYYIGLDGLCVLFGLYFRFMTIVDKVIYWAIDFVPKDRFDSKLKNEIYHFINTLGYRNAAEMWDLSPRMKEARKIHLGIDENYYRKLKVVPYGFWTEKVKRYKYSECQKDTIVFMGHLIEKQGVQLIIRALVELPDTKLKIIGMGSYKSDLEDLAKQLGVLNRCEFMGKIEDIRVLEDEIAKSCIALAPYIKSLDKWTYYADPGKVKTYLACGVPVLLTDLPWNSVEIETNKCGYIITEDKVDIVSKIKELQNPIINELFRENAIKYSKNFDYGKIFDEAVGRILV